MNSASFSNSEGRAMGKPLLVQMLMPPYRYRNSSSCSSGSPGPWSGIAAGTAN